MRRTPARPADTLESGALRSLRVLVPLCLAALIFFGAPRVADAHGVEIEHRSGEAVEVEAAFDNGEIMDDAQVTIYAPDEPSEPWETGSTDEEGRYVFMPDTSIPGTWDVQVREAGHGALVNVDVDEGAVSSEVGQSGGSGYDTLQLVLMGAAGIWGFVGTALFFMRRGS